MEYTDEQLMEATKILVTTVAELAVADKPAYSISDMKMLIRRYNRMLVDLLVKREIAKKNATPTEIKAVETETETQPPQADIVEEEPQFTVTMPNQ